MSENDFFESNDFCQAKEFQLEICYDKVLKISLDFGAGGGEWRGQDHHRQTAGAAL